MKHKLSILLLIFCLVSFQNADAQIFKKMKERAKQKAKELENKALDKVEKEAEKTIDKALEGKNDPNAGKPNVTKNEKDFGDVIIKHSKKYGSVQITETSRIKVTKTNAGYTIKGNWWSHGHKPFYLAQKALIKAKLKQKDSALHIFHSVIEHIHSDSTTLAKDYSNFKPSKVYGEARLIRRVAEKLELFYSDDKNVQKTISKLYSLAFIQFENSYAKTKFNPTQNDLLRKIIYGVLATTKEGTDLKNISINKLLSSTETMMNQMTWQRFYQNRYTNNLPALDSLKYRHLKLRTLLTAAKKQNNIREEDSILNLINQHDFYKAENAILLADIGHYESEQYTKNLLFEYLTKKIPNFAIILSAENTNPIKYS